MKHLFSSLLILMFGLFTNVNAQTNTTPCVATFYVINNSNDGTMVVTFSSPLPSPQAAPQILSIVNTTLGVQLNGTFTWKANVTGKTSTNLVAYYSYTAGANSQKLNNANGSEQHYQITIQYPGFEPQTCDVINQPPPSTLPVKFVSLKATPLGQNKVQVDFEIAEATNVDHFEIWFSKDGTTWQKVIVPLDSATPNKKYSTQIPLNLLTK